MVLAVGHVHPSGHPKPALRDPSPMEAFGSWDVHLWGFSPARAHNNLLPIRSRARSSLWRAHHVPPNPPPFMSMVCVLSLHSPVARMCGGWRVA